MAKAKNEKYKFNEEDETTIIEFKNEQKTLAELKLVYNFFCDHPDADLMHLMKEMKKVIDANE